MMRQTMASPKGRGRRTGRTAVAVLLAVMAAVVVAACGSSNGSGGGTSSTAKAQSVISGLKQTGPGLTEATTGSGAHLKGGTVTFAEAPDTPPVYIFPMYSGEYCGNQQSDQLIPMLYRPLYWYGNKYTPTVDYNYSVGQKPIFTDGNKVVTIHLNHYMWSDGEQVSARDLVFWMNMVKANPSDWCGFVPGRSYFPGNVVSYRAVNTTTFQLTLDRSYNPTWVQYNLLSQMYPMPIAWDRSSLSQKAPSPTAANLPDTTKAGATSVYKFLNAQSLKTSTWGSSPIWGVVDGPWRIQSSTTNGGVTFVPNTHYTGPVKPTISKFIEVPFTSESALVDDLKSQGTSSLTIAYIPSQYAPLSSEFKSAGYDVNTASLYEFNYFTLNLHNPTVGPIFRQLYFRQAFQHLIDQNGWITHFLHGVAVNTSGPVPSAPQSPLASAGSDSNGPYPFSVPAAAKLLTENGWKVVPGGASYCAKPGTGAGECGAGIKQHETISFNIDTASGLTAPAEEMQDVQSQASKVGIKINLTTHPFPDVQTTAVKCSPSEPSCKWTAENFGGGWSYSPDYYPTGEDLLGTGSLENLGSYSSPEMDRLIKATITAPASQEAATMAKYVHYAETQVPLVYEPTSIGTFVIGAGTLIDNKLGGYTANAYGLLEPEQWYLTK